MPCRSQKPPWAADEEEPHPLEYRFNNGVPNRLTLSAEPFADKAVMSPDLGIYVQDQWSLDQVTLNLGLRFDYWNGYIPEQTIPARAC